ncbi:RagB/SusD family nutrient uptake outer membrane protein [Algibacter lectus]|uniref:Putative outer membrane starch-binding protein n=1 Tax=Algibacter lectus TaxID=221126 RepID=A0A4V3HH62_9FLAO|nr:RagB/SusD family nutrient uptake outer membrane protein [Algibacter lectus]MWW23264.1 RagB/SusD family nutrient uptake outer membrane protein [Algibacter lectus]TDY64061.1 putative outer membrane starch-binding protein [Algibacter lectus]
MKNKILYLFVSALVIISCDKALDITPDGRLTLEDVFKDEHQTEAYLNTVYSSIPSYSYYYHFFTYIAGVTDECQDAAVGNTPGNIANLWITGAMTPDFNPLENGPGGHGKKHYDTFWAGIRNANVFLENVETANIPNDKNRERYKAEALILRAFYYLELIKQYGPMPIVTKPFGPAFDYTTLIRPTFQECTDFIVNDCDEAIANSYLPLRITLEPERGRFSKAVAYAIKSQALLYNASPLWNPENSTAKWQAASTASEEALSKLTDGGEYELFPDYEQYFFSSSDINPSPRDRETILEIKATGHPSFRNTNALPSMPGQNNAGITPTQELVDSYDMLGTGEPAILGYNDEDHLEPIINTNSGYDPANPYDGRDPRFYATVWYNGALLDNIAGKIHVVETFLGGADALKKTPPNKNNTHTGYYLRKFHDPKLQNGQNAQSRWKKYHLAEIYLNYAEAENEANGPTVEAYNAINKIRERVGMPNLPAGLSKDEFRKRVRNERRVELVIEEHRFWDVRRWKILDQTDKLVTGMEVIKNGDNFEYERFVTERRNAWQDKFLIFPIPIKDTSIIPDFNDNQNPGW